METTITLPSTVDGIRRLAKSIKRELGVTHHVALDAAARKSGYQNFKHAKRAISAAHIPAADSSLHTAYLTAYWREQQGSGMGRKAGCETLEVGLSRPLSSLLTRNQLGHARNLGGFKMVAADHAERIRDADSKANAEHQLQLAAATLHFLAVTGLTPAYTQRHLHAMEIANELPRRDHYSWWIDPSCNSWLVVDEPYSRYESMERECWARDHGLCLVEVNWSGLYRPGHCVVSLLSPSSSLVDRVRSQVEALENSPSPPSRQVSEAYFSQFKSPVMIASGREPKRRPMASYGRRMGAEPYGGGPGVPSSWRPAEPMPLSAHMTVGPILHALCNSPSLVVGAKAYQNISLCRSTLEDWAFIEHRNEISREVEERLYYGGAVDGYETPLKALSALAEAEAVLRANYIECKPKREILALLGSAAADIRSQLLTD